MKINISNILRSTNSSKTVDDSLNIPLISYKGDDIPVKSPIEVKANIINAGDYLTIEGTIKAELVLKCSRCLEGFEYVLETDFDEKLSNRPIEENDEDIIFFEGDTIDLTDIVINNILLSLPLRYICSEECKGLCPKCGKNSNIYKCNCSEENLDPRLEVLKDFLKDS